MVRMNPTDEEWMTVKGTAPLHSLPTKNAEPQSNQEETSNERKKKNILFN